MYAWAVTVNVGGGPGGSAARTAGMTGWVEQAVDERQPAVVFAQEVPSDAWLAVFTDRGYTVTLGCEPVWRIRSAVITAPGLKVQALTTKDLPNLGYHGSYVAGARWLNAPLGTWGQEYYDRAVSCSLTDWLTQSWGTELPTRGGLQLDQVLTSPPALGLLLSDPAPHLDPAWANGNPGGRSDHAPVWFALRGAP